MDASPKICYFLPSNLGITWVVTINLYSRNNNFNIYRNNYIRDWKWKS